MILTRNNPSHSFPVPILVIATVALIFPLVNIIYVFYPISFLGKNIWLVLPVLVILTFYLSTLFKLKENLTVEKTDVIFLGIMALAGLIFYFRDLVYAENRSFLDFRYIFSPVIFLLVLKRFIKGERNTHFLSSILITICLIQAVLGILHTYFFPELNISFDPDNAKEMALIFDAEKTREGGTLGASIYANVIVCGMFLLATKNSTQASFRSSILSIISVVMMLYAVTLSGSRYPIVVAGLLTLIFFSNSLANWRYWAAIGVLGLFSFIFFTTMGGVEFNGIFRFNEDSGGRGDKFILPFELITANMLHLLVGASTEVTANTFSSSGVGISDNSYWLLSLQFGPVFALVWFGFVINLLKQNIVNHASFLFIVYFLIGLGITNCILWEPWIFLAILTAIILHQRNQIVGKSMIKVPTKELSGHENGV
jgi:hypothetical protein